MADFTITVSNGINIFAGGPPSLWGTAVWGVDKWGSNSDVYFTIGKNFSNAVTITDALQKKYFLTLSNGLAIVTADSRTRGDGGSYTYTTSVYDSFTKTSGVSSSYSL